jgi:HrpA-like RNA helicase
MLPVSLQYDAILSLLECHPIVAIGAGTGTGKTTQVPQILADFVWNHYHKTWDWLDRVVVAIPTRVGAQLLFNRLTNETDCRSPGNWIALRIGNKEFHIGESGAFLTIVTHGYLMKALDAKFLNDIAFLVLDESQQRSLEISFCKAILKISRGDTRLVFMGAGLNVDALAAFFGEHVGSMFL